MVIRRLVLATALALAASCSCDIDTSKIDAIRCRSDADCAADRSCEREYCVAAACSEAADCGDRVVFDCVEGVCAGQRCESTADCGADASCSRGFCVPGGACDPPCDDGRFCNGIERCDDDGTCLPGDPPSCDEYDGFCALGVCDETADRCVQREGCDDGLGCTEDSCDAEGSCQNRVASGCLVDGVCLADGDVDPANPCRRCDATRSQDTSSADDSLVPDDEVSCTLDTCLDGSERHTAQDGSCGEREVCATCAGGCVRLPDLALDCDDTAPAGVEELECTLRLLDAGQADCLECTATIGISSLVLDGFEGCQPQNDGWTIAAGAPRCPVDAQVGPDPDLAEDALEADEGVSSEVADWTLERFVDTRDFDAVRLCFDYADEDGDEDTTLEVLIASDVAAGNWIRAARIAGDNMQEGDDTWFRHCYDLDAVDGAAADNAALGLSLVAHSSGGGKNLYVDNVAVDAWDSDFVSWGAPVLETTFGGCDLGGWQAEGAAACPDGGAEVFQADGGSGTLSRDVDLGELCDDVRLQFVYGTGGAGERDLLELYYDPDPVVGDLLAWSNRGKLNPDESSTTIEVGLSHRDPTIRWNPALGLRFVLSSSDAGKLVWIDDVVVDGATCASGAGVVQIGAPQDSEAGLYRFGVQAEVQTSADVTCTWDGRTDVSDRARIAFRR
jgi:hypothetical protein